MGNTTAEALRSAAKTALEAQDRLLHAWRRWGDEGEERLDTPGDVELLMQLIKRRIDPVNAFGALIQVDQAAGVSAILDMYVGTGVCPDTKFGGYTFELCTMLDDLRVAHGEAALRDLIDHPRFNRKLLRDPRVVESFCQVLEIDKDAFPRWLSEQ